MKRLFWCCLLAAVITKPSIAQDVPQWVREAAGCTIPAFGPKTAGVVLLAEKRVVVEPDGGVSITTRYAPRFFSGEARSRAFARAVYRPEGGNVGGSNAWLLRPSLPFKRY